MTQDQAFIIDYVTGRICESLKSVISKTEEYNINDYSIGNILPLENTGVEGIHVSFIGLEPVFIDNPFEMIEKKEKREDGSEVEFMVKPALKFKCTYLISPFVKPEEETVKFIGLIIKHFKDNNEFDVGEYDWAGNESYPLEIKQKPDMDIFSQMNVFNYLKINYRPALFYEVIIGIDSGFSEGFTRVEERKFIMEDKTKNRNS